jgi:hypothetical protein
VEKREGSPQRHRGHGEEKEKKEQKDVWKDRPTQFGKWKYVGCKGKAKS